MSTAPTTPPVADYTILLIVVGIAVIAFALIAVILVFVFWKRKQKPERYERIYETRKTERLTIPPKEAMSKGERKPFEVFLCYKKSSGKDYADHLKTGLEEVGLHTFEDCKDIPLTVTTDETWTKVRDQALTESKYFLLIMTPGFDLSSEVVREISMARKQANKTFIFFRHRSMGRKIIINLDSEMLDISQVEQVSFESKEELLRLAINIFKEEIQKINKDKL